MKLVRGDGKELTVHEVSAPVYRVRARIEGPPIKFNDCRIIEDDVARALLVELRATGLYDTERLG